MRRISAALTLLLLAAGTAAAAAFPGYINYQGKLGNPAGNPLTGTYSFRFRLYSQATGGTLLATDANYTGANAVAVTNGLYSVQIGSLTAGGLPESVFHGAETWLEIDVSPGTNFTGSETLAPRERLAAAPFAFRAVNATKLGIGVNIATFTSAGDLVAPSSITANAFFGDGSHLTGIPSTAGIVGAFVAKAGDAMTGPLTVSGSSITVIGSAAQNFSLAVTTAANRSVYNLLVSTYGSLGVNIGGNTSLVDVIQAHRNVDNAAAIDIFNNSNTANARSALWAFTATSEGGLLVLPAAHTLYGTQFADRLALVAPSDANASNGQGSSGIDLVTADAAGDVRIYTGGLATTNERMRVLAGGNVGIGTATPAGLLHIKGPDGWVQKFQSATGNTMDIQKFSTRVDFNDSAVKTVLSLDLAGGLVGIGTTNPATRLDVEGNAQFGSGATKSTFTAAGRLAFPTGYTPTAALEAATKGYVDAQVTSGSGWTRTGTVVALANAGDGAVVQSTLTVQGNAFSVGGSTVVVSGGNVGIGTTSPLYPLNVQTAGTGTTANSNIIARFQSTATGRDATIQLSDNVTNAAFISMTGGDLNVTPGGGSQALTIKSAGNVGIGATAPATNLDVYGNAQFGQIKKATFTVSGGLELPYGVTAATGVFSGAVSALGGLTVGPLTSNGLFFGSGRPGSIDSPLDTLVRINSGTSQRMLSITPTAIVIGDPSSGAPTATQTLRTTSGDGPNNTGSSLIIAAGAGSGTGLGGAIIFQSSTGTVAGSVTQSYIEHARITPFGNFGIGTTGPGALLHLFGTKGTNSGQIRIEDGAAMAAGVGGKIVFAGSRGTGGTVHFAGIQARKDNATDNDYAGSLIFETLQFPGGGNLEERMRIASAGNVGIGTTSPASKLHVLDGDIRVSTSAGQPSKGVVFQDGSVQTTAAGGVGGGWTDTGSVVQLVTPGDTIGSTGAGVTVSTHLIVSAGNVGIGTTVPAAELHVSCANAMTSATPFLVSSGTAPGQELFVLRGDGRTGVGTADNISFNGTGNAKTFVVSGSGASAVVADNDVGIVIRNANTTTNNTSGLHFAAASGATSGAAIYPIDASIVAVHGARTANQYQTGQLAFLTSTIANAAPTEKVRIDNNGNVGIGTPSPAAKLHVRNQALFGLSDTAQVNQGGIYVASGNGAGGARQYWVGAGRPSTFANSQFTIEDAAAVGADGTTLLTIYGAHMGASTGFVGIGRTDPGAPLDVRSAATAEGTLIARFSDATPTPMVEFFNSNDGTVANAANAVIKVKRAFTTGRSINAAGTINASGADYAEWVAWEGEKPAAGTLVRHRGRYMVVSSTKTAAFTGNDIFTDGKAILIAFMGQLPVSVRGSVREGDLIVPEADGTARAVRPAVASFAQYREAIGTAWASSERTELKTVLVAVGIK